MMYANLAICNIHLTLNFLQSNNIRAAQIFDRLYYSEKQILKYEIYLYMPFSRLHVLSYS